MALPASLSERVAVAVLALTVAGCGDSERSASSSSSSSSSIASPTAPSAEPESSVVDLYVADQTKPCVVGPKPRDCLQLRWNPNESWELSWNDTSSIAGFQYQPGYVYHLRVEKTRLPYPPPDAPQYTLRLVEVVSKQPAG